MSLKSNVIKGVKWTTLNTIVLTLCTLLKFAILARLLDKADFGIMAIITFVMGFVELFMDMGISIAILHKQEISKDEYSSLYWINVFLSIFLFLIILGISPIVAGFYKEESLKSLIPLMGATILLAAIGRQYKTVTQKELNFRKIAIIEISAAVISLISAVILAVKGFGILALIYSVIINFGLANFCFLISGFKKHPIRFHFKYSETKSFLKIGIYQVGSQIVNYFNRDLDILLIGKIFGAEILGGYNMAKQLVFRPAQVINPILTQVAAPALAKIQTQTKLLKDSYLNLLRLVSSINFLAYLAIIIFAPILVQIFYGNKYSDIVGVVQILSVYMYVRALGNPIGSLVVATGKTYLEFYWNLFTLLIMPLFIYVGAQFSIEGVAIFISLAMIVLIVPHWYFLVRKMIDATLREFMVSLVPDLNYKNFLKLIKKQ